VDHTGLPSTLGYGEHLTHQSALDLLQPGDVIVVLPADLLRRPDVSNPPIRDSH
jgi:hypothetical protein